MPKLLIFYYSSSGNTEKMAQAVAEGAKSIENIDVQLSYQINVDELNEFHAIIIGTPTYRKQMPIAIKTFLDEVSTKGISLKGKIGAVFGSYGWSGEAPQSVLDILKNKYEMHVIEPPIMAKYSPDQKTLHACKDLGQKIAKMLPQ